MITVKDIRAIAGPECADQMIADTLANVSQRAAQQAYINTLMGEQMTDFCRLLAEGAFPLLPQATPGRFNLLPFASAALERVDEIWRATCTTA